MNNIICVTESGARYFQGKHVVTGGFRTNCLCSLGVKGLFRVRLFAPVGNHRQVFDERALAQRLLRNFRTRRPPRAPRISTESDTSLLNCVQVLEERDQMRQSDMYALWRNVCSAGVDAFKVVQE